MGETTYCADDETLSETVIRALAAMTNYATQNVRPLYESIDPEALDELFDGRSTRWRVVFDHAGYRITVHSTGEIQLEEIVR